MKVGDLCSLKSGGPVMTVGEISGDLVTCQWFEQDRIHTLSASQALEVADVSYGQLQTGMFREQALRILTLAAPA